MIISRLRLASAHGGRTAGLGSGISSYRTPVDIMWGHPA
jgi:hypothetical protein